MLLAACDQCNTEKPIKPIGNVPYLPTSYSPIKCIHGEKIVDKIDCSRYIACIHGEWYSLQCEDGTVFDSASGLCIHQSKSRCPRNGSHLDSFHQSPQISPGFESFPPSSPGFRGDAFPPAPPPPPKMDEIRREMYEKQEESNNGFLICSHESPQFVADPRDCGSYLECQNGFYQSRTCSQGYNFDAFSGRCSSTFKCDKICQKNERIPRKECGKALECHNNAWVPMKCKNDVMFVNGRCSDIPCPSEGYPPSTCFEGAVYSNERDCTRYVICRNGQLIEKQCSNGQKFNDETLSCSYKYDCSAESSPKCFNGERRAIPDSCTHFDECRYGTFVKSSCPYGKSFNSITKKCQPGPCQGSGSNIGEACTESPGLDGFLPDPLDCRRFYQCTNGRWVGKNCGPGTAWSGVLGVCDHIRNVPACART
uniref:Chitin-binding type-2 domain-containing protein n=1 Tax=Panagrolaimus superbus TaxID=310955 RepID=A0A914YCD3_9BILA